MAPTSMASAGVADHYYHAKPDQLGPVDASSSDDPSAQLEDEEWVGCDGCSKWRKVPAGFQFDRSKSFFCSMIESLTCDTPEEQWDEEEEFVDRGHIIDDRSLDRNDSSRSTTPRGSSGDSQRRSGSKSKSLYEKARSGSALAKDVASERATGKRKCFRPRSYGAEGDGEERWRRSRRAANGEDAGPGHGGQSESPGQRANRGRAEGPAGGVQGMSRLDAVVRVLKATGKALHYNIITRQALQQGIIRFTGSQGTAGESMKAFLNKTIRENKTAAIVNMGKGVYGLKVPPVSPPRSPPSPPRPQPCSCASHSSANSVWWCACRALTRQAAAIVVEGHSNSNARESSPRSCAYAAGRADRDGRRSGDGVAPPKKVPFNPRRRRWMRR